MDIDKVKTIRIIPSKSYAHRAYICDFLAGGDGSGVICSLDSDDIKATMSCLSGLADGNEEIDVRESGSTLRFILPLAGALGKPVLIRTRGRLSERPMGPFEDELISHGMSIEHLPGGVIKASGQLASGEYRLPGSISSQFITGLLLSLPYLDGDSRIVLTSELQSSAYVDITLDVLKEYGIRIEKTGTRRAEEDEKSCRTDSDVPAGYAIKGGQTYRREMSYIVEGDWSQAAFWLAAGVIGKAPVRVAGLNNDSVQGDRKIADVLRRFGAEVEYEDEGFAAACPSEMHGTVVDVSEIPDLAPAIACAAAAASGETRLVNAGRLRLKESDRISSIVGCLKDLGFSAEEGDDEIIIQGIGDSDHREHRIPAGGNAEEVMAAAGGASEEIVAAAGGTAETAGDHRIVMMAAVLSLITSGKVTIQGSSAVSKSYPTFFEELDKVGLAGNIQLD